MKNDVKILWISIMLCLFVGMLSGGVKLAVMSKFQNSEKEQVIGKNAFVVKDLDASGKKYTALIDFIAPENMNCVAPSLIERDVRMLLKDKNITDVTNEDINEIVEFYKKNGIIICTLLINGKDN
jgi:dihydrodipicolinate reductase